MEDLLKWTVTSHDLWVSFEGKKDFHFDGFCHARQSLGIENPWLHKFASHALQALARWWTACEQELHLENTGEKPRFGTTFLEAEKLVANHSERFFLLKIPPCPRSYNYGNIRKVPKYWRVDAWMCLSLFFCHFREHLQIPAAVGSATSFNISQNSMGIVPGIWK